MDIRILTEEDREQCTDLWRLCFTDPDGFVKWFFQRRYCPAYSAGIEENGALVCVLHGYPFSIKIRDFTVPGAMISGVSTHPDHRGKGLMKKLMAFEMQNLRHLGCAAVTHTPVEIPVYRSCGHLPCSDSLYFDLTKALPHSAQTHFCTCISDNLLHKFLACYRTFAERYSAILFRTAEDMRLKSEDYFSDHMGCAYAGAGESVLCYAFYKEKEDNTVYVEEMIYQREEDALALLSGIQSAFPGKMLQGKLPPDFTRTEYFCKTEIAPQTVMGLVNPDLFLPHLRHPLPRILLQDPLVPQNNVEIIRFDHTEDTIQLQAGMFMQLLTGYRSAAELLPEKNSAVSLLEEALPKQTCFIIDAY